MAMHLELQPLNEQLQDLNPDTTLRKKDDWKKSGRVLSGLVGSNVLLFNGALATCVFTESDEIYELDFLIFLSTVMVVCILWMFFQMHFSRKKKNSILFRDCQAGPTWMRGGIILFGCGTLIMLFFKIGFASGQVDCATPVIIIHLLIQAFFVTVQTCFLWMCCKHCVQIYVNATRCFLMVLLSVNLTMWIIAVAEESSHHADELQKHLSGNFSEEINSTVHEEDGYENTFICGCKSRCMNTTVFAYLYPFNIEYNLFAAAMIYVMWKNVGRQIDENASYCHGIGPGVRRQIPFMGLFSGLTTMVIGLAMFIVYEVGRDNHLKHWLSLTTFYIFHVVSLTVMSLANVVGIIIFRLDKRQMCNEKNPSRTLDMALLVGATLGQYAISYYSIIAMVSTQPFSFLCGLTLSYSILMIIQHTVQNAFIIKGLHRLPPHVSFRSIRSLNSSPTGQYEHISRTQSPTGASKNVNRRMTRGERIKVHIERHLKKRKTMKDVYLFLFLTNIIFWIMSAFGAQTRLDSSLEIKFYGFTLWAIISNICLPFGIFYRMHAAATLLELYSRT
ncbi:proton channel OTOP2-like [Leptodactylus fuscus]|uniref:proton channel OTOP2-like n=1 Tax=Leptodactylus fuscus TaxID=238119 RepID=UPI003F4F143F